LTRECAEISGIPHVMDVDKKEVEQLLKTAAKSPTVKSKRKAKSSKKIRRVASN
jgi:hypothetical protein